MTAFHLEILSPEKTFYAGPCVSLTLPFFDGSYGVMAHHTPLTGAVVPGEFAFTLPDGSRVVCAVSQGMAAIQDNRVRVLCESVLRPEEIDEEKERREAEKAREDMKGKQSYKEYRLSQIALAQAMNNLRVKKRSSGGNHQ